MAVDTATGDVLVIDAGPGTVSRYHPDGTPSIFSALGSNVIDGTGPGDETPQGGLAFGSATEVQVAIGRSGATNGDIFVTQSSRHVVDIFADDGTYLGQLDAAGPDPLKEPCGVTTDAGGSVYVSDYEAGKVYKYQPSSNPPIATDLVASFGGLTHPCALASGEGDSAGSLAVAEYNGPVSKLDATTGALSYLISGESNTTVSVNPDNGYVYVARGSTLDEYDISDPVAPNLVSSSPSPSAVEGVASSGNSGQVYRARSGAARVEILGPVGLPAIENDQVATVDFTEATINATINPEGSETTYRVEYGPTPAYGFETDVFTVGSDETGHAVSTSLVGLASGTAFHWRIVAENSIGVARGSDQTFTTFAQDGITGTCPNDAFRTGSAARLPSCRAYELVSPVEKNNTDILSLINLNSNLAILDQSAAGGDALTYTTSQGFGDTQGVPYVSQYLANRGAGGWTSHGITPPQGLSPLQIGQRVDIEFRAFTDDLCSAVLRHTTDPPLTADAVKGFVNIYLRSNCGGDRYQAATTSKPPNQTPGLYLPEVQGISADGRCALFYALDQLTPNAAPGGAGGTKRQLYESCDGQLKLVSVLPSGVASPNEAWAGTGAGQPPRGNVVSSAISKTGSRVYWTNTNAEDIGTLYLRENADKDQSEVIAGQCLEADKACTKPISEFGASAHFWGASSAGDRAVYSAESVLYEYEVASGESTPIAFGVPPSRGVVGVSADAQRVTFLSEEVLTATPNSQANLPSEGSPNLYLYDASRSGADRYRYIGTLSAADVSGVPSPVEPGSYLRTSRVSPDGRHVVFMSTARITGYDNTDAHNGQANAEIYVYDAEADASGGRLTCASCNPSGKRPSGENYLIEGSPSSLWVAAVLPPYQTELYGSRVVSDDGEFVFFNTHEALVPRDTNHQVDVYQWTPAGSGNCDRGSGAFSDVNGGCVNLISTGESPNDSEFVDASADGGDVFFTTASSLVAQDPGLIDIYDARIGGGYAAPAGVGRPCEGEACQPAGSPPVDPLPGSSLFQGSGNVVERKCGKKTKAGHRRMRCSKKRKHKHRRHHRQPGNAKGGRVR